MQQVACQRQKSFYVCAVKSSSDLIFFSVNVAISGSENLQEKNLLSIHLWIFFLIPVVFTALVPHLLLGCHFNFHYNPGHL